MPVYSTIDAPLKSNSVSKGILSRMVTKSRASMVPVTASLVRLDNWDAVRMVPNVPAVVTFTGDSMICVKTFHCAATAYDAFVVTGTNNLQALGEIPSKTLVPNAIEPGDIPLAFMELKPEQF